LKIKQVSREYAILGLDSSATLAEVKKAYRRLVRKYHPDVNSLPDAKEHFLRIQSAYQRILDEKSGNSRSENLRTASSARDRFQERQDQLRRARIRRAREFAKRMQEERDKQYIDAVEKASTYFAILFVAAITFFIFDPVYKQMKLTAGQTDVAWAKITEARTRNLSFIFYVDGVPHESTVYVRKSFTEIVVPNGMPVEPGQFFQVKYNVDFPNYNKVNFDRYSAEVGERYQQQVFAKLRQAPKFDLFSDNQLACIILEVYRARGTDGLALLYFFNEPVVENPRHNRMRYALYKKSTDFESLKTSCLQKHPD
jgi:hypothetical protein